MHNLPGAVCLRRFGPYGYFKGLEVPGLGKKNMIHFNSKKVKFVSVDLKSITLARVQIYILNFFISIFERWELLISTKLFSLSSNRFICWDIVNFRIIIWK